MHLCPRDASVYVLVLHPCPMGTSRSGRDWQSGSVGEDRTQAPSASGLVWRTRMLGHLIRYQIVKNIAPFWISACQ